MADPFSRSAMAQEPLLPAMPRPEGLDADHISLIEALRHTANTLSSFAARHPESWIMHPAANFMDARRASIAAGAQPVGPFVIPTMKAVKEGLSMYPGRLAMGVDAPEEAEALGGMTEGVGEALAKSMETPSFLEQGARLATRVPVKVAVAHDLGIPTSAFAIVHGTQHKIMEPMTDPTERAAMHESLMHLRAMPQMGAARRRRLLAQILSNPVGSETMYPLGRSMAVGGR